MKKLSLIFTVVAALMISFTVKAQTTPPPPPAPPAAAPVTGAPADYFPGKWNVVVMGTPNGDAKMTFVLTRTDGKLAGAVQDSTGKEMTKIPRLMRRIKP